MLPPLVMCLVLTGIHGYLGIHVLSRKVIFVDLALAQIAAFGTAVALVLGWDPVHDATVVYLFSLGFTFLGAAVFAITRMRHERVPQEAFIGITYATGSALAILLLARTPGESEHIKEMLVGNILLVTWPQILKTAVLYGAIGVFHWAFRKPFLEISLDPEGAVARGRRIPLWDFAFYASFGFVITSSVRVAGVLLVFSYLVVPAVISFMFQDRTAPRIAAAWAIGTLGSAAGMVLSYYGDLPTGPSVVGCFAAILVLASTIYFLRSAERRAAAILRVAIGAAVVTMLVFGLTRLKKGPEAHAHETEFEALVAAVRADDETAKIEAIHHLPKFDDAHTVEVLVEALRASPSERVIEHILEVLPELHGASAAVPAVEEVGKREELDSYVRFEVAEALLRLESASGFDVAARLLDEEPPLLLLQKLDDALKKFTGNDFGLTKDATAFHEWMTKTRPGVRWRPERQRFE
jgi:zinc/manganese transport system permease protein